MTGEEWLASDDPAKMLAFAHENPDHADIVCCRSDRKLRLLGCAFAREIPFTPVGSWGQEVMRAERLADEAERSFATTPPGSKIGLLGTDALAACQHGLDFARAEGASLEALAALVREVIGNPFRPVTLPPSWLTPDVVRLARGIYADADFAALPVLRDALEEAGCAGDLCDCMNDWCPPGHRIPHPLLAHLRGPGPHVRGCWALDLVAGKE